MPVEDNPRYDEWSRALDRLKEANDRFRAAQRVNASDIEAARKDLHDAQEAFDKIADEIE